MLATSSPVCPDALAAQIEATIGRGSAGMTTAELKATLLNAGINRSLTERVVAETELCDAKRFGSADSDRQGQGRGFRTYETCHTRPVQSSDSTAGESEGKIRMTWRLSTIVFIVMALTAPAQGATVEETYKSALDDYHQGQYGTAISSLERLVALALPHTDLYFNLANAYYRTGEYGRAIYNYRRALSLEPDAEDVRFNLQLAMKKAKPKGKGASVDAERPSVVASDPRLAAPSGVGRAFLHCLVAILDIALRGAEDQRWTRPRSHLVAVCLNGVPIGLWWRRARI